MLPKESIPPLSWERVPWDDLKALALRGDTRAVRRFVDRHLSPRFLDGHSIGPRDADHGFQAFLEAFRGGHLHCAETLCAWFVTTPAQANRFQQATGIPFADIRANMARVFARNLHLVVEDMEEL